MANQRDLGIIESYERSSMYDLWDAYGSFSYAKKLAWDRCLRIYHEYTCVIPNKPSTYDIKSPLKVIGANTFQFSAGFIVTTPYNEKYLVYITANGVREIKIEED